MKQEYKRFIRELKNQGVSDGTKKIAQLIYDHIDELIPLGTHRGNRSKKIISIAQREFSQLALREDEAQKIEIQDHNSIKMLNKLEIQSFRGFSDREDFDLNNKNVFLFGPNGAGKSSFCEALEYSLLGSVEEAESKRFSKQEEYLQNARTKEFTPPILLGIGSNGSLLQVLPNEERFRFCFVEKNRIDSFARIAAKTPSHQTKLIGSLFGLESFDEFVKDFSSELDDKYIDLAGLKGKELADKKQSLIQYEDEIKNEKCTIETFKETEKTLASEYDSTQSYDNLATKVGLKGEKSRIEEIEELLKTPLPPVYDFSFDKLTIKEKELSDAESDLKKKRREYEEKKDEISFRDLYASLIDLKHKYPDKCPACFTPLSMVSEDPYKKSEVGLKNLEHLSQLEANISSIEKKIQSLLIEALNQLKLIEKIDIEFIPEKAELNIDQIIPEPGLLSLEWWNGLKNKNHEGKVPFAELDDLYNAVKNHNSNIEKQKKW